MTSEEEIGYYPFPNSNLDQNIGERYVVPPELDYNDPQKWLLEQLIQKKIISKEITNSPELDFEPRFVSDKKDVALFGEFMEREYSHLHAIKNEHGYNYVYRLWLQLLSEQVSQGKRSVRLLRLASFEDEEERATEVWNYLSRKICEEITTFCEISKPGTIFNDVLKLSEAYDEIHSFNDNYSSIFSLISKETVRLLFSHSKETDANWKATFRKMKRGELNNWFDEKEDEDLRSSDFGTKSDLIDYIMETMVSGDEKQSDVSEKTRSLPIPNFIMGIVNYIERKILTKYIRKLPKNKMLEKCPSFPKLIEIFSPDFPTFGHKRMTGVHNSAWHNENLDWRIRRASEKLGHQILKILTCKLKWVNLEKGSNFDILLFYSEELAMKMIDDRNIPNMMFFSPELFLEIPKGVSEARRESLAFNPKIHEFEPHSIFRFFERDTKHWMYCKPAKHIEGIGNGGSIIKNTRTSVSNNTSNSLMKHNIKGTWGETWNNKWPKKSGEIGQEVCDALNNLQNTQWEINFDLLNLLTDGFKITHDKVPYRQGNNLINLNKFILNRFAINEEIMHGLPSYRKKEIKRQTSLKLESIRKILKSIFKIIRNGDNIFWLPWNIDFRGRIICKSVLSPQESDFSKAIIRFKEWKILGESGWKWMKIHTCNLLSGIDLADFFKKSESDLLWRCDPGAKKKSFASRIKWTEDHIDSILAVCKNLNDHLILDKLKVNINDFIKPKSEMFQRLSVILEFERLILEFREKNDWNQIKSGLPIHFDASCNGFQHAAALLQDLDLARKVNLLKPDNEDESCEDLYTEVAEYAKTIFDKDKDSKLRKYLQDKKEILGISEREILEFREIFTRDLAKRPTIAKGYGQNRIGEVIAGITSWKDNSSTPRVRYNDTDWNYYLSNSKSKNCHRCQDWNGDKKNKGKKKRKYKFETLDDLREHNFKKHKVRVWHIESPLYKNIKIERIREKIDSREWCSEIQMEIAEMVAEDLKNSIDSVTNDSFGTLGEKKLQSVLKEIFFKHKVKDLKQICLDNNIELNEKETETSLKNKIKKYKITFENGLPSWKVLGPNGLQVTYFKTDKTKKRFIGPSGDINDEEHLIQAYKMIEQLSEDLSYQEILDKYEIKSNDHKSVLGKTLLRKLINDNELSISDEFLPEKMEDLKSKIFDIAYKISVHRNEDTKLITRFGSGITPNFVHSLDGAHMRYVINSMAENGIQSFWAVHDDFGTHAANIEMMREIIKEEFVKLHKGRNIDWWCSQMSEKWEHPGDIDLGDFDLDMALESEFLVS